jgi:hypothetical protein
MRIREGEVRSGCGGGVDLLLVLSQQPHALRLLLERRREKKREKRRRESEATEGKNGKGLREDEGESEERQHAVWSALAPSRSCLLRMLPPLSSFPISPPLPLSRPVALFFSSSSSIFATPGLTNECSGGVQEKRFLGSRRL